MKRSAEAVKRAWDDLEITLAKFESRWRPKLRSGVSETEFAEAEKLLQLRLPDDVRALFLGHDGEDIGLEDRPPLFELCYFIPLISHSESAVAETLGFQETSTAAKADSYPPQLDGQTIEWKDTLDWLLFAKDFDGAELFVNLKTGHVIQDVHDGEGYVTLAESIVDFLETERNRFERG